MQGRSYGSDIYFLIDFYVRNSHDETTSLTCPAEDDLSHLMGDPEENMLKIALAYIANNYTCP